MRLVNQPPTQFAVLMLTGIIVSAVTSALLTNYRGLLTSYAHRLWRQYQKPWYQKAFLWTRRQRAHYSDEAKIRRTMRVVAGFGAAMGIFFIVIEFTALVTGHVT